MEYTIYLVKRHEEDDDYFAHVLSPGKRAVPKEFRPFTESADELHAAVKKRYGEGAIFLEREQDFLAELDVRMIHTKQMLELLRTNATGDLQSYRVYGSLSRPMDAGWARLTPDAVYIPGDALQEADILTYIAVPAPLDESITRHFNLVFVSRPALLSCPQCGSTDPRMWMWVQYTRVNYTGIRITKTTIEVEANGIIEYASVSSEYLRCQCGGEIDHQERSIVYV